MSVREIERKWLVDGFPSLPHDDEVMQTQGYLSFKSPAVRIRKTQTRAGVGYRLTIKGKGTLTRTEVELELEEEQFAALSALVKGQCATKRMRLYPLPGGQTVECSLVDEGEPCAFYYAEVEFASEEEAGAFVPPEWFGREVTEEEGFTMADHCQRKSEG